MNPYKRIYNLLTEGTRSRGKIGGPRGSEISSASGRRSTGLQHGTSMRHAPGTAKPLKLAKAQTAVDFDPSKLAKAKTTTEPLLPSGEANPAYTAIIKRFRGKLSPAVIAAMKKRLSSSEENVSTQAFRQGRGK